MAPWTLFVLFLTNVFNVGDRLLLGVVAEPVRGELGLSDTQLALANGLLFMLFNLVAGLLLTRVVDRGFRKRILVLGLVGWSLATAATGLAQDFTTLAIARIGVGIGEATSFPVAMSMIPDLFRTEARGKAVSVFQSSGIVGTVLGTLFAGLLAGSLGWRAMFGVCGAAGLAMALVLALTVDEPRRSGSPSPARSNYFADLLSACGRVIAMPGFVPLALAFGISAMTGAVLGAWGPAFLQRSHDVSLAEIGVTIGVPMGIGGLFGTLLSGVLSDWLVKRRGRADAMLQVPLLTLPLGGLATAAFVAAPTMPLIMASVLAINLCMCCAVPPFVNYAITHSDPGDRAVTSTIMLAATGLLGGALGPFVVGAASDALVVELGRESLRYSIGVLALAPFLACAFLLAAMAKTRAAPAGLRSALRGSARELL